MSEWEDSFNGNCATNALSIRENSKRINKFGASYWVGKAIVQ